MKHVYKVTVEPDEDMGLDDVKEVRELIKEAIRDSGIDNGASITVEILPSK